MCIRDRYRAISNVLYAVDEDNSSRLVVIGVPKALSNPTIYDANGLYARGIGDGAFQDCVYMTRIALNTNLSFVGEGAFRNCASLQEVNVNAVTKLESLGAFAFENCISLQELLIPDTVRIMGSYLLKGCSNFRTLVFEGETPPVLEGKLFSEVPEDFRILVPSSQDDFVYQEYVRAMPEYASYMDTEDGAAARAGAKAVPENSTIE